MLQVMTATADSVAAEVAHGAQEAEHAGVFPTPNDFDVYRRGGGYALLAACLAGRARARTSSRR